MQELEIFKNEEFGTVRTILIDNEPWFVGKDVAEILGYENPQKAIFAAYEEELKKSNALDFDDLILKTIHRWNRSRNQVPPPSSFTATRIILFRSG